MGTEYKVHCRHCGTETALPRRGGYGKFDTESRYLHIETEIPIRCPRCLHRLNNSTEEFRSQIKRVG